MTRRSICTSRRIQIWYIYTDISISKQTNLMSKESLVKLQSLRHSNMHTTFESNLSGQACTTDCFINIKKEMTQESCFNLFRDLIDQFNAPFESPPLRFNQLQTSLHSEFSLNNTIPMIDYYFDANQNKDDQTVHWNEEALADVVYSNYCFENFQYCRQMFDKYTNMLQGKRVAIIGSLSPWLEASLLLAGVGHIITSEYLPIHTNVTELTTVMPHQLANRYVTGDWTAVDFVMSFSSIEHNGLGRYGDPLDPYGDLSKCSSVHHDVTLSSFVP